MIQIPKSGTEKLFKLLPHQEKVLEDLLTYPNRIIVKPRHAGKTWFNRQVFHIYDEASLIRKLPYETLYASKPQRTKLYSQLASIYKLEDACSQRSTSLSWHDLQAWIHKRSSPFSISSRLSPATSVKHWQNESFNPIYTKL